MHTSPCVLGLTGMRNHDFNLTQLHLSILQVLTNLLVNVAGMPQITDRMKLFLASTSRNVSRNKVIIFF